MKEQLKRMIADGQIKEVIQYLRDNEKSFHRDEQDTLIGISSRFASISREQMLGTIGDSDYRIHSSRICRSLLDFLDLVNELLPANKTETNTTNTATMKITNLEQFIDQFDNFINQATNSKVGDKRGELQHYLIAIVSYLESLGADFIDMANEIRETAQRCGFKSIESKSAFEKAAIYCEYLVEIFVAKNEIGGIEVLKQKAIAPTSTFEDMKSYLMELKARATITHQVFDDLIATYESKAATSAAIAKYWLRNLLRNY